MQPPGGECFLEGREGSWFGRKEDEGVCRGLIWCCSKRHGQEPGLGHMPKAECVRLAGEVGGEERGSGDDL